jgi:hypothetical protein
MTFFEPRDAAASKHGTGLATEVGLRVKGEASLDWWDAIHGREAEEGVQ